MEFAAVLKRAVALIMKPKEEWAAIDGQSLTVKDPYRNYALILYAIPPAAHLIGLVLSGVPVTFALVWAVIWLVLLFIVDHLSARVSVLFAMGIARFRVR